VLYEQVRARTVYQTTTSGWDITLTLVGYALTFALVPAAAFGFWNLFMTHRICGPLFALEDCLSHLKSGKFPDRRGLRKHDEFKDFHNQVWSTIDSLKEQKQRDLEALVELRDLTRKARGEGDKARGDTLRTVATRLDDLCREAAEALGRDDVAACPSLSSDSPAPLPAPPPQYADVAG